MLERNQVYLGDCLKLMPSIADKSIDMILCDLPYGTTACKWDTIIPFEPLWEQYKRIIKDNGAIVLTASEPFASYLRTSNIKMYKHDWIWNKKLAGNGVLAKIQPLKIHEIVCVFSKGKVNYHPTMRTGRIREKLNNIKISEINGGDGTKIYKGNKYYPVSVLDFSLAGLRTGRLHPTQKPVALFEYLIKTYTSEGDLVLDNCAGSGTTGVAAIRTKRDYILIEKEEKYYQIILERIKQEREKQRLF
jgi:site-specific DNA-methyltransferase (adenine-specific)